jgi:pimeloyl-ACP methyl ester carboxylesterase
MTCISRDPNTLLVGETELPAVEVDEYVANLVRWNGQAMYQPLTTARAAWRDIPVTYIHTTKDMTVPFEYQKYFVDEMRKEGVKVQSAMLETGHCATFTAAKEVADIVERVIKGDLPAVLDDEAKGTSKDEVKDAIFGTVGKEQN